MTDDEVMRWLDDEERGEFTADKAPLLRKLAALRSETHEGREYDLDDFIKSNPHVLDGVENNMFRLDGKVFEAIEDENDGYRSSLKHVVGRVSPKLKPNIPPVSVRVEVALSDGTGDGHWLDFRGHRVVTEEGRTVLLIGTNNTDDYYPSFVFYYRPVGAP